MTIEKLLRAYPLPTPLHWFEVDGQIVFPLYGPSGALAAVAMAYIVQRPPQSGAEFGRSGLHEYDGGRWYSVEFLATDEPQSLSIKIRTGIEALMHDPALDELNRMMGLESPK